jgi:hypothetical protein
MMPVTTINAELAERFVRDGVKRVVNGFPD